MTHLSVALLVLLAAPQGSKESFDIARFVAPPGWQRQQSPGLLMFQSPQRRGGPPGSALLVMKPSQPSAASPEENFAGAWQRLVSEPLGGLAPPPQTTTEQTPDGWTAISGAAPYVKSGGAWRAILVTATGHGRTMSFVVHLLGTDQQAAIDQFFKDLDLVPGPGNPASAVPGAPGPAPEAVAPPSPGGGDFEAYVFSPPKGWTRTARPGEAIAYVSPPYPNTGEQCQLVLFPMRPGGGDLMSAAAGVFQTIFKAEALAGYPYQTPALTRGISPFGWQYLTLQKALGQVGETAQAALVFVASVGGQLATIVATSKAPLVSQCFGEQFPSEWPPFFHSLRFKNAPSRPSDPELKRKLVGSWTATGGRTVDKYLLAANGRYANGAAIGSMYRVSPTEIQLTTYGFRGDGAWTVKANAITFAPAGGTPEPGLFRLEEASTDGRTWVQQLCILNRFGDVCYRRDG